MLESPSAKIGTELQMEAHQNPHAVSWHARQRLIDSRFVTFWSKDWLLLEQADERGFLQRLARTLTGTREPWKQEQAEMRKLAPLVDSLFFFDGVEQVTVYQYHITVEKGQAFRWEEDSLLVNIEYVIGEYLKAISC